MDVQWWIQTDTNKLFLHDMVVSDSPLHSFQFVSSQNVSHHLNLFQSATEKPVDMMWHVLWRDKHDSKETNAVMSVRNYHLKLIITYNTICAQILILCVK